MPVFVAMNRFQVNPERAEEFERGWRERDSYLEGVPGYQSFALLRGDVAGDYVSHSIWESRDAFRAWTQSDNFRQAHARGSAEGVILGHPQASFYEAILEESAVAS
jgi:heme-degrading monooxygenase HmoA